MTNNKHPERAVLICFLALIVCTSIACSRVLPPPPPPSPPPPPPPPPVILLVFVDVTRSLEKGEVQQVAKLSADVLDQFPTNTRYTIYPIQMETERPTAIDEGYPRIGSPPLTDDEKADRRKRIIENTERAFNEVNNKQPVDRTCILNILNLADRHFYQAANGSTGSAKPPCMELVIISDMIEQCAINPMKTRIDLLEIPLEKALELAKQMPSLPDLSRIRVTVIVPTAAEATPYAKNRPRLGDLELFWDEIFMRCGFKKEDLRNFNWLPTLPARFETVCQPQPSRV